MSCDILNLIGFSSVHYYKAKPLTLEAVEIIFSRSRPASVQNSRAVMDIKILILKTQESYKEAHVSQQLCVKQNCPSCI
ncbi:hypothetical protein AAZX31_18G039200 [Glycine max]